jgi:two-component system response regulator NreC
MTIKILLADDHKILREGLKGLLDQEPSFQVVGEADDGSSAVRLAAELQCDVIVMDITMPDLNGIDATRMILQRNPDQKVLALSVHSDRRFIERMLDAGARGYLRKDCASRELIEAIRTVMKGETYISPAVAASARLHVTGDQVDHQKVSVLPGDELTHRERQVLQLVAEGKTTREIATRLSVSVKAIEKYRQSVMEKLDLHSIADLTRYAISEGIISLER